MFGYKNSDLRRPSVIATTVDESPNGADVNTHHNETVSLGGSSSLSISKTSNHESVDIIVIGDDSSNKTRFISSFLNNGIGEDPQLLDISCRKSVMIQSGAFNVNMYTTAGQEEFWGVNDSSFRQGHGFIFVYNVNSRESFNQFLKLRERIIFDKSSENIIMAMIGYVGNDDEQSPSSSSDVASGSSGGSSAGREVSFSEAKRMADLYSCSFNEFMNFDRESENQINNCISDLVGRITNSYSQRGRSNSISHKQDVEQQTNATKLDVLLVGDIFCGKTQFVQRLIGKDFSNSYRETNSEWEKSVFQTTFKDSRYFVKLVDTRGHDLEHSLNRERLNPISGFIFVYSTTSKNSFNQLENLKRLVLSAKSEIKVPCAIIATKSDSLERQVLVEEGQKLAQQWGCPFYEVSNINDEDEILYKPIHQLLIDIQKSNHSIDIGDFKKKGYLMKEGKKLKSMSKYFFKTHKGNLQFCKNEIVSGANNSKLKIKTIELSEQIQIQIVNSDNKKDIWPFQIIDPVKQYYMNLLAPSEAERDAWVTTLKLNCYANEVIGMLVDDVVKSVVTEIAEQSMNQNFKRSDSTNRLSTSTTPLSPSPLFSSANGSSADSSDYSSGSSNSSNNSSSAMSPQLLGEQGSPFKKSNLLIRTSSFKGKTNIK